MPDKPGAIQRIFIAYADGAVRRMLFLGFAAGLPLPLVFGTLSFRLREAGVDLATIGFVSWVTLTYGLKWVWAPLVDALRWPILGARFGQRRSWLLVAQFGVIAGLLAMAVVDPATNLAALVVAALGTAFCAATQDVALDAFRIESAPTHLQATLAAAYQAGYRVGMIWASAGALGLAARAAADATGYHAASWSFAYGVMAASMLVGTAAVLATRESATPGKAGVGVFKRLASGVEGPFTDFAVRFRGRVVLLLGLVATYRLSDIVMGVMANPFYRDLGFTKLEVATVSKIYGVAMTIVGALIGGAIAPRLGILATMGVGAAGAAASGLLYAGLALRGHDIGWFSLTVSIDNLSTGIAGSAFIAYLSSLTNRRFSATQYAVLSSMMLLVPKWLAGFGGAFVERFGYATFFCTAAGLGLPAWLLIALVARTGVVRAAERDPGNP